jgi:isopentenyl-diphosphate delta-isomerase
MSELLDVLDSAGQPTGQTKTKDEILRNGDWRRAVHIWIVGDDQRLLVQQRAEGRGIFDGFWDISVGGGVRAGEPSLLAAQREVGEELGLNVTESAFIFLGTWKLPPKPLDANRQMNDFSDTYLLRVPNIELGKLILQAEEVQAVDVLPLTEFERNLQDRDLYADWVQHGESYYHEVIAKIFASMSEEMND